MSCQPKSDEKRFTKQQVEAAIRDTLLRGYVPAGLDRLLAEVFAALDPPARTYRPLAPAQEDSPC